ncbi:CidA/LrgA family holin-like protein [Barrientosiimonas marina]|uniref:CidA/LrgA family protein n=1 Tax=Lentibacillus kimchii TaxID=1542911 RepID=A0ABW2UV04_9BACI
MKIIRIIVQIVGLYVIYLIGQGIQHVTGLPIPGSIIGMILLFFLLLTGIIRQKRLAYGSSFLLAWLPLLFLPSAIGVIKYESFFAHKGLWLIMLVFVNTVFIMAISSLIGQRLATRDTKKRSLEQ